MQPSELSRFLQEIKTTREKLMNHKILNRARLQEGIEALNAALSQLQDAGEIEDLDSCGEKDMPGVMFLPKGAHFPLTVYCTHAAIVQSGQGSHLACTYQVEAKGRSHEETAQVQDHVLYTGENTLLDKLPVMIGELQAEAF